MYICTPSLKKLRNASLELLRRLTILLAGVMELVDMLDLGSSAARCRSSSLLARTKGFSEMRGFFITKNLSWHDITWGDEKPVLSEARVEGSL